MTQLVAWASRPTVARPGQPTRHHLCFMSAADPERLVAHLAPGYTDGVRKFAPSWRA